MKISIIIVTYNRPGDLNDCLNSILIQSCPPYEVIIIDNSTNKETKKLAEKKKGEFIKNNILLKYVRNEKENSLTVARNIGVRNATGKIICFLDDDIVLDENYLEEIKKTYNNHPDVLGVHGYIAQEKPAKIRNFLYKNFFLYHLEENRCRVLPSTCVVYPLEPKGIISCQWLPGASTYRKGIFQEFSFDENLKKYSDGEDLEFSYQVFKKYPNSLFITPYARLIHKASPAGRTIGKELISMREVYSLYLFYKLIPQTIKNKIIYLWSRIGKIILNIISSIFKLSLSGIIENFYLVEAYIYCLRHQKEIKKAKLEFFNNTLRK